MKRGKNMRDKIYTLIKKTFDEQITAFLPDEPQEGWEIAFVSDILNESNSAILVEEILKAENEDLYWLIWDNGGSLLPWIPNPLPLTQAMIKRWKSSSEETFNAIRNVTEEMTTKRLRIIPMDKQAAEYLRDVIEKEGKHEDFLMALECYDMPEKIFFSLIEKDTDQVVGYVGLSELPLWCGIPSKATFNMEYYTVPKKRKQGYLKEGGKEIIHAAFDKKIIVKEELRHERVLEAQPKKIKMIKISCDTDNKASYKSALAMGFEPEGIISLMRDDKIYKKYLLTRNK